MMQALQRGLSQGMAVRVAAMVMLFPIAALLGHSIAHENWLIVGGLFFIPLYLLWPVETSLGLFALFVPFEAVAMLGGSESTTISWLAGAAAGCGLLAVGVIDRRLQKPPKAALWWGAFVGLASVSSLWAYDPDQTLKTLPTILGLAMLYFAAVSIRITKKELFWVTMLAIVGGVLASFISVSNFYHGVTFSRAARSTITQDGRESDPNFFAAGLLLPLSLAVGAAISEGNIFRRLLMGAAAGVVALGVLLTMSRGALVAILVMVLVYAVRYRLSWKIIVPTGIVCTGLAIVPDLFFSRWETAAAGGGAGRLDIWIAGVHAFLRYGLYGAGFNNFPSVYGFFAGYAPHFRGYDRDSHNMYLATAVELGIAGLFFMAAALYSQLQALRPPKWASSATRLMAVPTEAACWAAMVAATFLNPIMRKYLWLTFIMVALSAKAREASEREFETHDDTEYESDIVSPMFDTGKPITTAALVGSMRRDRAVNPHARFQ